MLGTTAVRMALFCAVEYAYGKNACFYAGGILVLGGNVTTTNDRRQRWTRLHSLSFLVQPISHNSRVLPKTIMSYVYLA